MKNLLKGLSSCFLLLVATTTMFTAKSFAAKYEDEHQPVSDSEYKNSKYKHERGTFYLRVGAGAYIPGRNIFGSDSANFKFGTDFIKAPDSSVTIAGANDGTFGALFNMAVGFNIYGRGLFHFGMEFSTDLNFGTRQNVAAAAYLKETGITGDLGSILLELKFRFGFNVKAGPVRVVPYITFGAASELIQGQEYKYDFNADKFNLSTESALHPLFGVTYGAGIMVNSRQYPVGFYFEFTVPTMISLIPGRIELTAQTFGLTPPSGSTLPGIKTDFFSGVSVIFAPRFSAGVMVGF